MPKTSWSTRLGRLARRWLGSRAPVHALACLVLGPTLWGCLGRAPSATTVVPVATASAGGAFGITDLYLPSIRLVGAESFVVEFQVEVPVGRFVKAYGIRTAYEETLHPLPRPLPIGPPHSAMRLELEPLSELPLAGPYPFEFWLINEHDEPSNEVSGRVIIQ